MVSHVYMELMKKQNMHCLELNTIFVHKFK